MDSGEYGVVSRVVDCVCPGMGMGDGDSLGLDAFHGFFGGDSVSGYDPSDSDWFGGYDFPHIVDQLVHSALI